MYSRIFIRLAAPLALTLLLPFAIGFEWPAALRWAILTTMTLSWLGFAWWTARAQAHRSPEQARVLREQDQLLTELRSFVGNEIDGSRGEVERARDLIRQAVSSLGGSFDAMNRKSRQQSQALSRIVDRAGDEGSAGLDVARFAQHASHRMEQLVEALEQVSGQSSTTVQHIDQMAQHLDGIFALLEDVKSIADQTNLLALNAAIEAARAGEQGRGFAVVADEVRQLAQRTTNSTQEIAAMIEKIQAATQAAMSDMEVGVRQVNGGVDLANQAGEAVVSINTASDKVVRVVNQISLALREQTAASHDVARTVERLAQMAQQNSEAIGETVQTAVSLDALANDLNRQISQFRC